MKRKQHFSFLCREMLCLSVSWVQQHCRIPAVGRLSGIDQNDFIPKLMIYVTQREHCQTGHFLQSCQEADGNALECSGCSGWETLEFLPGRNVCHENFFVMPW